MTTSRINLFVICVCSVGLPITFATDSQANPIVRFDTEFGAFDVELFDSVAPATVNNFLNYVTSGRYANTLVHRSTASPPVPFGLIQGGAFDLEFDLISTDPPVPLEYQIPNARGTIGMGRQVQPDSATSQWYINTTDNSDLFGPLNAGGFAVFGQVLGDGMDVVDAINAIPTYTGPAPFFFPNVPLHDYTPDVDDPLDHTVVVNNVTVVPEPPAAVLACSGVAVAVLLLRRNRGRRDTPRSRRRTRTAMTV